MRQEAPATRSPYYPPRAGSPVPVRRSFQRASIGLRRWAQALKRRTPSALSLAQTLAALLVPGLVFHLSGPRFVARLVWAAATIGLLIFLVGLGTTLGNVGFGILISAHVISVSHVLRPTLARCRLGVQMLAGLAIFALLTQLIYMPARDWFHENVALPLQIEGRTVVVNPRTGSHGVKTGDWVAYRIARGGDHTVMVHAGYGFGPVLAMPGDRVGFGQGAVVVNGSVKSQPGSTMAPEEITVPEDTWFIWPRMRVTAHGVSEARLSAVLRQLALVPQTRFVGRPFGHWFFRKQTSP